MAINKVVYGDRVLIDITSTTAVASDVTSGKQFYLANGTKATGTSTKDANTSDATANAGDILSGKTAYKQGQKLTGTMANRGAVTSTISTKAGVYTIPAGYHNGNGKVSISTTEQSKIIPENIKENVSILGVVGIMAASVDPFVNSTVIANNSNLNDLDTPGVYRNVSTSHTVTNSPDGKGGFALLMLQLATGSTPTFIQLLFRGSSLYQRYKTSSGWSGWYKFTSTAV